MLKQEKKRKKLARLTSFDMFVLMSVAFAVKEQEGKQLGSFP